MPDQEPSTNLPVTIAEQIAGIPKALVPATLKALDRLIGGTVASVLLGSLRRRPKLSLKLKRTKQSRLQSLVQHPTKQVPTLKLSGVLSMCSFAKHIKSRSIARRLALQCYWSLACRQRRAPHKLAIVQAPPNSQMMSG